VTDYAAAVSAFATGDLDLVWFGGLTGVQARLQAPAARAIAQRDIDEAFHSVFIANAESGIEPFDDIEGLSALVDRTFTFGSESSTSGRLMPQHFLQEAGVTLEDFAGEPGFSGSHDATIQLVEAGSYDAGALNEQVWQARLEAGEVDPERVIQVWRTPAYYDYHWVIREDVDERYGDGFVERAQAALLALDAADATQAEILDLFGAGSFIETRDENYAQIEAVGRAIGRIQD
jgi:phosphonate transport system substrate-binding protein